MDYGVPSRWSMTTNSQILSVPIMSAFLPGAAVGPYVQGRGKPPQTIPPNAGTYQFAQPSYAPGGGILSGGFTTRTALTLGAMLLVGYLLLHIFWRKK